MSKKDNYIKQLKDARVEHKKWLNQIRLIVSGLQDDKNAVALSPSESPFGEWLYSKALSYSISKSALVLSEMEFLFEKCYEEFHKIYGLLLQERPGLLANFFGGKKASHSDYMLATQYYEALLGYSDKLMNKLQIFENQLVATNEEKFEQAIEDAPTITKEQKKMASKPKEQRYYRGSLIED